MLCAGHRGRPHWGRTGCNGLPLYLARCDPTARPPPAPASPHGPAEVLTALLAPGGAQGHTTFSVSELTRAMGALCSAIACVCSVERARARACTPGRVRAHVHDARR